MSMRYEGRATNFYDVDLSGGDYENPTDDMAIIFCVADGQVNVIAQNGVAGTKAMVKDTYWKVCPKTILDTTTATVQLHS